MRLCIVGLGSIGSRHLSNARALGVTDLVVVRRARNPNPQFPTPPGVIEVHGTAEAVDLKPDAVIICSPTSEHVLDALPFCEAGIRVLVEKPLATTRAEASLLAGYDVSVGYCWRHHPSYRRLHYELAQGEYGPTVYADFHYETYLPHWHPWEDYRGGYAARLELGGGVLPTLDHHLDWFRWTFGVAEMVTVDEWRGGGLDLDVHDCAKLKLRTEMLRANFTMSFVRRPPKIGFEIVCRHGVVSVWDEPNNAMYRDMLAEWLGHGKDVATVGDGLAVLELMGR